MNDLEFAQVCKDYKDTEILLAKFKNLIQEEVLERKATQDVMGVKASYYKPSREYDYEAAAQAWNVSTEVIDAHSTITKTPRWKEIAESIGADVSRFYKEKPERVVIR